MLAMASNGLAKGAGAVAAPTSRGAVRKTYRSASTGRIISEEARIAAAQARVTADKKRGVVTPQWIKDIAAKDVDHRG